MVGYRCNFKNWVKSLGGGRPPIKIWGAQTPHAGAHGVDNGHVHQVAMPLLIALSAGFVWHTFIKNASTSVNTSSPRFCLWTQNISTRTTQTMINITFESCNSYLFFEQQKRLYYYYYYYNHFTALWILSGTTGWADTRKKHSTTHTFRGHQSSLICISHLLWSTASMCWIYVPDSLFAQSLSKFSGSTFWSGTLHFIHFFTHHCLLFAAHAHTHTIATCFAVVPRLCHLILI